MAYHRRRGRRTRCPRVWSAYTRQTRLKSAKRQGAVRKTKLRTRCCGVSKPRWVRTSWKVVSMDRRAVNQLTICGAFRMGSLDRARGTPGAGLAGAGPAPLQPAGLRRPRRGPRTLSGLVRRAAELEVLRLEASPFKKIARLQVPERIIRPLSVDEQKKLLDACAGDSELDVYVRPALDSGCRAGELSDLRWENLDLKNGTGTIECSSTWRSKTRRSRFIAFTPETAERLRVWRVHRLGQLYMFRAEGEPDRAHYRRIRDRFDAAVKRARISRRTLHDLRRTVGPRIAVAGINQKVAAAFLGHQDIATTSRF